MSIRRGQTLEEVAFEVSTAMELAGFIAVLSGGGAATVHAPAAYQSHDLDFVLQFTIARPTVDPILTLGFQPTTTRGTYAHPEIVYTLEFIEGPLAVGDEVITQWHTWQRGDRRLHIISPTDCVRDRLAAAIHWRDLNSARQAAEVAKLHPIDLVQRWCEREGGARTLDLFRRLMGEPS